MPRIERTALIVLAAGRSRRFASSASKLEQMVAGRPLGLHAAAALSMLPFRSRIAVTGRAFLDWAGLDFDTVQNPDPDRGMASSVRLGADRALANGTDAAVIALADMPRVTPRLIGRLFEANAGGLAAATDGRAAMPPALFGPDHLPRLATLADDRAGARDLLRGAALIEAEPGELIDIDTLADLDRLAGVELPGTA